MFGAVLDYDLKTYGQLDLNELIAASSKRVESSRATQEPGYNSDMD